MGQTPFVVAMSCRDNDVAASILTREPSATEQVSLEVSAVFPYF